MTANPIGSGVTLKSILDDVRVTMYLPSGAVAADVGKHVKLTTTNNTVAFCTDGDVIFGILDLVEDHVSEDIIVGTIVIAGGAFTATYDSGDAVVVGEAIVSGADTAGVTVKRIGAPTVFNKTIVVGKDGTAGTIDYILRHA